MRKPRVVEAVLARARLGVDVGGSSIKLAPVDVSSGEVIGIPERIELPIPSSPERVVDAVVASRSFAACGGPIGIALPSVVQAGVARTAANIDARWIDCDARALFEQRSGRPTSVLNDADAAGVAEITLGAGAGLHGKVFVLTLGTGIGSALFLDGRLWANTELGHLMLRGPPAVEGEHWAAARVRTALDLDYRDWTARLDTYLRELQALFWPDAFILGGAVTEDFEIWRPLLSVPVRVLPAKFRGAAGIVGAALATL